MTLLSVRFLLSVRCLLSCLSLLSGAGLPVGFWGKSVCWVSDFLFGFPVVSDYRTILSGADLPVGFLISCLEFQCSCLGFSLPVGEHFS